MRLLNARGVTFTASDPAQARAAAASALVRARCTDQTDPIRVAADTLLLLRARPHAPLTQGPTPPWNSARIEPE